MKMAAILMALSTIVMMVGGAMEAMATLMTGVGAAVGRSSMTVTVTTLRQRRAGKGTAVTAVTADVPTVVGRQPRMELATAVRRKRGPVEPKATAGSSGGSTRSVDGNALKLVAMTVFRSVLMPLSMPSPSHHINVVDAPADEGTPPGEARSDATRR